MLVVRQNNQNMFISRILFVLGGAAFIFLAALVFAFPTMWLWNWLMPMIFGLIKLTLLQSLGLNVLCGILFKSNVRVESSKQN